MGEEAGPCTEAKGLQPGPGKGWEGLLASQGEAEESWLLRGGEKERGHAPRQEELFREEKRATPSSFVMEEAAHWWDGEW